MSADDRRELLIQAAIRVMSREGVAGTTTRAIVAEAGMPLGMFHYCFRSKGELLEQVLVTLNESSFPAEVPGPGEERSFAEVVRDGLAAYWDDVKAQPARHQLSFELTLHAVRTLPDLAVTQYDAYRALIGRFLTDAAESTGSTWLVPLDTAVNLLLAAVQGSTFQYLVDGDHSAGRETLMTYADSLAALVRPT